MKNMKVFLACAGLLSSFVSLSHAQNSTNSTIDLSMLGTPSWSRFRPGWSLTVNDQCVYEFVFQYEHDSTLPMGYVNFQQQCVYKDPTTKVPPVASDGIPYLVPRKFWEQFPNYVWATIGIEHLSIDWYPCGHLPRGYAAPLYSLSFFRVTPEYRALAMTCDLLTPQQVIAPLLQICNFQQDTVNGMNFNIIPSHILDRNIVDNMPVTFERPQSGIGPEPYVGQRSWDQVAVPATPNRWDNTPVFMSSYAGDLAMWQAKIPYTLISGKASKFTGNNYQYFQPTLDTLPDTHAFEYDPVAGVIRFYMVGKAGLCRSDFQKAQAAAGGPPVFPNWDTVFGTNQTGSVTDVNGNPTGGGSSSTGGGKKSGAHRSNISVLLLHGIGSLSFILLWAQL